MKSEIIFILCLIVLGILFGFVYKIQNENIETSEIKEVAGNHKRGCQESNHLVQDTLFISISMIIS